MTHVLDSDNFANRHFLEWLDNQYSDSSEWLAAYSLIWDFLEDNPDWILDHSWFEILLAASGGEPK